MRSEGLRTHHEGKTLSCVSYEIDGLNVPLLLRLAHCMTRLPRVGIKSHGRYPVRRIVAWSPCSIASYLLQIARSVPLELVEMAWIRCP